MRYVTIEILIGSEWSDRTDEIVGQSSVPDGYTEIDAQAAVNHHYHHYSRQGGTPPTARLVCIETVPSPGGPQ